MPVVTLNSDFIKNQLRCPPDKSRIEYCCDEIPGFYVEVRATSQGHGTFYQRVKVRLKTGHQRLGCTTTVSLADARKLAKKVKAEVSLGADPRGDARASKAVPTLSAFFHEQYLPHVKPRKRSWKRDEELFRLRIDPEFGHLQLNKIVRRDVQTFHANLVQLKGLSPATADHHIKLIRHMLNLAVEWEILEGNQLKGLKQFNVDNQVENIPNDEQLQNFLEVLRSDKNRPVCLIVMFLMSTGCRLNEALQAKWSQINEESRVMQISARTSKSKKARSIPLNDSALYVLSQLDTKGKHENLFVNRQGMPFGSIMKVFSRLRKKAGLPNFRIHDSRHLFSSWMVSNGRTLYEVQQILGHADPRVSQRYARLSTKRLQEAAQSASMIVPATN